MKSLCGRTCVLALVLLFVPGTSITAQQDPAAKQKRTSWLGFADYPEARELSDEWILGQRGEEIHALCFATRDDMARVVAFYAKKDRAPAKKDDDGSVRLRHGKDIILSIYPIASDLNYPSCKRDAQEGEKTVIWISQLISRGRSQ